MSQEVNRPATTFFKIAAAIFAILLVMIIAIANRGDGGQWWSFINSIPYGDKLGHVGLMGTLGLLCNLAFTPRYLCRFSIPITHITALLLLLVTLEELSQAFISTRNYDPLDLLANTAGLALGQLSAILLRKI